MNQGYEQEFVILFRLITTFYWYTETVHRWFV